MQQKITENTAINSREYSNKIKRIQQKIINNAAINNNHTAIIKKKYSIKN